MGICSIEALFLASRRIESRIKVGGFFVMTSLNIGYHGYFRYFPCKESYFYF